MAKITVKGTDIVFYKKSEEDYISLTDIAKIRDKDNPSQIISLWLRTYSTIEYIGLWEMLNNPDFKPHIYEGFKNESAKPHFWMSSQKWISETNAIGITSNPSFTNPWVSPPIPQNRSTTAKPFIFSILQTKINYKIT